MVDATGIEHSDSRVRPATLFTLRRVERSVAPRPLLLVLIRSPKGDPTRISLSEQVLCGLWVLYVVFLPRLKGAGSFPFMSSLQTPGCIQLLRILRWVRMAPRGRHRHPAFHGRSVHAALPPIECSRGFQPRHPVLATDRAVAAVNPRGLIKSHPSVLYVFVVSWYSEPIVYGAKSVGMDLLTVRNAAERLAVVDSHSRSSSTPVLLVFTAEATLVAATAASANVQSSASAFGLPPMVGPTDSRKGQGV
jgi:hypothetical protein